MKKIFILAAMAGFSMTTFAADQAAAMDIAKKNGCLACHALDKKMVGPAWNDIGKKYAGDTAAAEQLAVKVKKGSKGVWGPVPMPPNATVKAADIETMVKFILTLK
ncbi:c-type cytochrome [Azonexus hydrophilus]|uniref:C-type cytochrome n=1 Tax=Azonexus hydrophilus TaxID=418702 RepID=A0ABZ2XPD1_9RHOO